jgi:hypothetical protein
MKRPPRKSRLNLKNAARKKLQKVKQPKKPQFPSQMKKKIKSGKLKRRTW